jgi:hypothetical protein
LSRAATCSAFAESRNATTIRTLVCAALLACFLFAAIADDAKAPPDPAKVEFRN